MNELKKKLVLHVRNYAEEHYEDGGWDVIVECWTDEDIYKHLFDDRDYGEDEPYLKPSTPEKAIRAFDGLIDIWSDRQADAAYYRDNY